MKNKKFASAMMEFFGRHPDQSLAEFMAELRGLNDADRTWFRGALAAATGWQIDP